MEHTMSVALILVAVLVAGCGAQPAPTAVPTEPAPGMSNPPSEFRDVLHPYLVGNRKEILRCTPLNTLS